MIWLIEKASLDQEYVSFNISCSVSLTNISNLTNLKKYEDYFVKLKNENLFFRNQGKNVSVFVAKITEIDYLKYEKSSNSISFVRLKINY
jgi:hypothetical protein